MNGSSVWRWGLTHMRRYPALYAIAAAWILMVALVPTVVRQGEAVSADAIGDASSTTTFDGGAPGQKAAAPGKRAQSSTAVDAGGVVTSAGPVASKPVAAVKVATGKTVAGYTCKPGVRQIPWSLYAPPCVAKFTGYNGGKTYNGVDEKTIKLAVRVPVDAGGPAAQAQDRLSQQTGGATASQAYSYATRFLPWFNNKYELYGRKVVIERFNGQGNSIDEAQNKGQESACADATREATSMHAFMGVLYPFTEESGVFTDCAARQQHMFLPLAAPYFPESYFQKWHPYAWDNTTQCERIGRDLAEYTGKRLHGRNAKWAGDPALRAQKRRFALYVPNDPAYQRCADQFQDDFKKKYGGTIVSRYNYALDVSQFPSEALRAVVQFQAANATTVILACDNISPIFLTQGAQQQGWHPEWQLIGVAGTDTDSAAASYDQDQVNGHLFGMSQLGNNTKLKSPSGEAAHAWREATGEKTLAQGAETIYYNLVDIFTFLQAAGPILTPQNAAAAIRKLPPGGGANGAAGTWSWAHDHTATIDAREIYWDGDAGTFHETYSGKRFQSGQWPRGEPPIYPAS